MARMGHDSMQAALMYQHATNDAGPNGPLMARQVRSEVEMTKAQGSEISSDLGLCIGGAWSG